MAPPPTGSERGAARPPAARLSILCFYCSPLQGAGAEVVIHHHRHHKNHLKMYLHRAYPFPETAEILLQAWFY